MEDLKTKLKTFAFSDDEISSLITKYTKEYPTHEILSPLMRILDGEPYQNYLDYNEFVRLFQRCYEENQSVSETYSMFPIKDSDAWKYYCAQEVSMWSAKELNFLQDREEFPKLPTRYQELYYDLLAFFAPGDGVVTRQVIRYFNESITYSEMMFFIAQLFIEAVHAESYGMSIVSVIPDEKKQKEIFSQVDNLACVKAKTSFILKYEASSFPRGLRFVAGAVSEGIFFVSLFAVIFYLRSKNILKTFCFMNEQISKDETLHRDFNITMANRYKDFTNEQAIDIVKEAVEIEINHLRYILREPIDSTEADASAGLTISSLQKFVESLGDQILTMLNFPPYYNSESNLPWLNDLALGRKSNFYEVEVGTYKKLSLNDAINWEERAGYNQKKNVDPVNNPLDIEF